jgi:CAAX prenyl protease-like protein
MNSLIARLTQSPVAARVAPFIVFVVLTFGQGFVGETGRYWIYLAKTIVGLWMLGLVRPVVEEMRWKVSWEAVAVGVAAFILWVGLDDWLIRIGFNSSYPKLKLSGPPWNPNDPFGTGSALAWSFILVRVIGSALIVPPLEEVFFRSFLYRYIMKADFLSVPLGTFAWLPFVATSILFGFEHREWLAGILCGFAYQGLVFQKKRLGDAITAHAITNFLLGVWVVWRGAWEFW